MPTLTSTECFIVAAANLREAIEETDPCDKRHDRKLRSVRHDLGIGFCGQMASGAITREDYMRLMLAAYGDGVVLCAVCDEPIEEGRVIVDKAHKECAEANHLECDGVKI